MGAIGWNAKTGKFLRTVGLSLFALWMRGNKGPCQSEVTWPISCRLWENAWGGRQPATRLQSYSSVQQSAIALTATPSARVVEWL